MISAKVIADSRVSQGRERITTMVVTMPRIILAEFNTHRMFSRNSASSRAIPFEKMVKAVEDNPFVPIAWQKDHKGMQGTEYLTDSFDIQVAQNIWMSAKEKAVSSAKWLSGELMDNTPHVTKQLCNRLLEPFMWHTVIVTATEWENFFALRCPQYQLLISDPGYRSRKDLLKANPQLGFTNPDDKPYIDWLRMNKGQAEIHMMALAEAMWDAYNESTPQSLVPGEWHIPFYNFRAGTTIEDKIKIATARCARVSYTVVGEEDKEPNYQKDIELHDRLAASGHWSPFEHCARVMDKMEYDMHSTRRTSGLEPGEIWREQFGWCGNFRGFIQYRKTFYNENIER